MAINMSFIYQLRLEPYLFILLFGMAIRMSAVSKLTQDKVCLVDEEFTEEACKNLHESIYLDQLNLVQPVANNYSLYEKLIINLPCLFLLFFVGSWIDKYKGAVKAILLVTTGASLLESFLLFSTAYNFYWPTWTILICFIPAALTGGRMVTIMTAITQVTKETELSMLSTRMAFLAFSIFMGMSLGGLFLGTLLDMTPFLQANQPHNYTGVLAFTGICDIISGLWILFVYKSVDIVKPPPTLVVNTSDVGESIENLDEKENRDLIDTTSKNGIKFADLFDVQNVTDAFRIVLKKRADKGRTKIFLVILASCVIITTSMAPVGFMFQFTEKTLHWNVNVYNRVNSIVSLISHPIGAISVPIFAKVLKFQDATLGIIGSTSIGLGLVCKGLFPSEPGYYSSVVIGILSGLANVAGRSLIKPLVEPHEIGRLFIFTNIAELFVDLILAPLFTKIFNATFETMPGFLFCLLGVMAIIPLLVFIYLRIMLVGDKVVTNNDNDKSGHGLESLKEQKRVRSV